MVRAARPERGRSMSDIGLAEPCKPDSRSSTIAMIVSMPRRPFGSRGNGQQERSREYVALRPGNRHCTPTYPYVQLRISCLLSPSQLFCEFSSLSKDTKSSGQYLVFLIIYACRLVLFGQETQYCVQFAPLCEFT
jgi:hypothetical protein